MDLKSAVSFIQENGGPVDLARLAYLLTGQPANPSVTSQLLSLQRPDGGWEPFWAADYSSLDATCYRLAQAEALGIDASHPDLAHAIQFLILRHRVDGSSEESPGVMELAPEWVRPGSMQARLYLTACCGFWVAVSGLDHRSAASAGLYLNSFLTSEGQLPSYLHASWLGCGLWIRLQQSEAARKALGYLESRLSELGSSNMAWLLTTLMVAGLDPGEPFLQAAANRLQTFQTEDGDWPGEDGPEQGLHTTLESLPV